MYDINARQFEVGDWTVEYEDGLYWIYWKWTDRKPLAYESFVDVVDAIDFCENNVLED